MEAAVASDPVKKSEEAAVTMPAVKRQPAAFTTERVTVSVTTASDIRSCACRRRTAAGAVGTDAGASSGDARCAENLGVPRRAPLSAKPPA